MANIPEENELRRYAGIEYGIALLSALVDGPKIAQAKVNRMTNLEALAARGFVKDDDPHDMFPRYIHKGTGLTVCADILKEKDAWRFIDECLEEARQHQNMSGAAS